jgi:hypothetical protein
MTADGDGDHCDALLYPSPAKETRSDKRAPAAGLIATRDMKADIARIKVRMDEICRAMATDPEVRNLREDVSRLRDQSLENEVCLGGDRVPHRDQERVRAAST